MRNKIKMRREKEHALYVAEHDHLSQLEHDLRKQVHGLSPIEKGKIYSGDRTPIYDKMGLLEESDLEKYMRKLHINREAQGEKLDLTNLTEEEIEELVKNYRKKRPKPCQIPKKDYNLQ